jgi:hypothetical protein
MRELFERETTAGTLRSGPARSAIVDESLRADPFERAKRRRASTSFERWASMRRRAREGSPNRRARRVGSEERGSEAGRLANRKKVEDEIVMHPLEWRRRRIGSGGA